MAPVKPMLDGVELPQAQRIASEDEEVLAQHGVPALEGDFFQDLGRRATRVTLTGVLTGPEAGEDLKGLREKFQAAQPVPFVADIATATRVDKVLIEEMGVRELAGKTERFEYALSLREYTPPPAATEEPPPEIPPPELPETATLVVEVIVEGDPAFDFSLVTVTVTGTDTEGVSVSRTLANRTGNVWTETDFPPGQYTAQAVTPEPDAMAGSAPAEVREGQTTQATITLRRGSPTTIAKAFIVHFRFDNSFVEPCMRHALRRAATYAREHRDEKMLVVGHTDKTGSDAYNQSLSERRARSVFAYLTSARDAAATATARSEWNTLRQRATGAQPSVFDTWGVHQYQYMLQDLGFYTGNVDGDHGTATDEAVQTFRAAKGLPPGTTVDDPVWTALIADYMDQDRAFMDVPESQLLPNARGSCNHGVLKWLGCGEEQPLPLPQPTTQNPHRPYRRAEILFVRAASLPCEVPQPDTFNLPTPGAVGTGWCLGPGQANRRCCFATRDCGSAGPNRWCIQPAEPGSFVVSGTIRFEDGRPAGGVKYVLIAPDGEFMDGEASSGARRGEGIPGQTRPDGTFSYPANPKGPGVYTMELRGPFIARAATAPPESARGNVVCQRLDGSTGFDVVILLEACRLLSVVHFEPERSFIRPAAKRALRSAAASIQASPPSRRVMLAGHADLVESPGASVDLSLRRTQSVLAFLTGNPPDPANPARSVWLSLSQAEGWNVREIQLMLRDLGFYCSPHLNAPASGAVDALTARGIAGFKSRAGLGNNAVIDDPFREALFRAYIAHDGASMPGSRLLASVQAIGCGSTHPADIRGGAPFPGASERNRRVEFLLFPRAPRVAPSSPIDCAQYPSWSTPCERRRLDIIGPKRPPIGGVPPVDPADAVEVLAVAEIANWENAYNAANQVLPNFIDLDPDRLFVQVTDLDRRGTGTVRARIRTVDAGAAETNPFVELDLQESANEPGVFLSASMLLVADEIDNGEINNGSAAGAVPFQARGIANGALNDPLLRAAIGGQLIVEHAGAELGRFPVCDPDCMKTVPVNIVILRLADGTAVTTEADVRERVRRLQQSYMQCGIRFDVAIRTATAAEMPAGLILSAASGIDSSPGALVDRTGLTGEERALFESPLNARRTRTDVVQVFYANRIDGVAATAHAFPIVRYTTPADDIVNVIVVGADDPEENSTLPHEMMHILLNSPHDPSSAIRTLIFFAGVLGERNFTDTTVSSNKRVQEAQCDRILLNTSQVVP